MTASSFKNLPGRLSIPAALEISIFFDSFRTVSSVVGLNIYIHISNIYIIYNKRQTDRQRETDDTKQAESLILIVVHQIEQVPKVQEKAKREVRYDDYY